MKIEPFKGSGVDGVFDRSECLSLRKNSHLICSVPLFLIYRRSRCAYIIPCYWYNSIFLHPDC